jgi:hypothetical protein
MSAKEFDKDILATMTDEEREMLESDEFADDVLAAPESTGEDGEDDDGDNVAEEAAPTTAAVELAAVEPTTDAEPDETPAVVKAVPHYQAALPDDHAVAVQAIQEEESALAEQFKSGELDFDGFRTKAAELNQRRLELSKAEIKAEISSEMQTQTAEQAWQASINRFMADTAKAGEVDYRSDAAKQQDLDQFVRVLANNPANEDKSMDWFLIEAHKRVKALHGIAAPQPSAPKPADKPAPRRPDMSTVPTTLAQVPGTDGPGDVGGDEFADLDRLEGMALEDAMHRMTPAQREKYLATV